jgi:capsular exopolysaccharide synthesis family protein
MKFIKALQKSNGTTRKPKQKVVQSDAGGEAKISRLVPGLVSDEGLKIGVVAPVAETEFGPNGSGDGFDGSLEVPDEITFREVAEPHATLLVDPQRVNRHLVAITDPKSVFAEEYRDLRTSLLQKGKKQKLQTIAIASVAPGEGKSVTALNLAWLLAQTEGVNALVIDGDMRRPSLSRYLGIDEGPGLSELLDGDVRLSDVLVKLEPSGLHLLPGGRPRSDVAEQISGPNFANILGQLQASFDFVIIDAPPLGVFVDAKVLINQADGALLVLRRDFTKFKEIDRVLEGLPRSRMLGVVLNQAEETLLSGQYYYDQY